MHWFFIGSTILTIYTSKLLFYLLSNSNTGSKHYFEGKKNRMPLNFDFAWIWSSADAWLICWIERQNFHAKITSFMPQLFRSNPLLSFLCRLNSRTIHNGFIQKQFKWWTDWNEFLFFHMKKTQFGWKWKKYESVNSFLFSF